MRERLVRDLFGAARCERARRAVSSGEESPHTSQDMQFDEKLHYFVWMPEILANIEFYFVLTMIGMGENLLSLLLLPLKCLVAFSRLERRDVVALVLIAVGMLTYYALSLHMTQLYASLYHAVRRTSFIKLVMVFNILEIADRLLSALSQEAIEVLTMCVQNGGRARLRYAWANTEPMRSLWLPFGSAVLSALCVAAHAVTLLLLVVTLNVAVNAEGHLLMAMIVGTNLSEVKGVAHKKHNRESLMQLTAADAVERLKFLLFFLVMVMQHMHEPFRVFDVADMLLVLLVEVFIDFIKHFFVTKFNGISPSVYRCYSQLTLLDMAAETVPWQIDKINIRCVDDPLVRARDVRALLLPSAGFFPKYVRRTGFIPVPYAALLLWSLCPFLSTLLAFAPLLFALVLAAVVLLKLVLSGFIRGVAARFVVRSLFLSERDRRNGNGVRSASVPYGVSPLSTPPAAPHAPGADSPCGGSIATLQLTSFLCSLLTLEPFDLQAGKARR